MAYTLSLGGGPALPLDAHGISDQAVVEIASFGMDPFTFTTPQLLDAPGLLGPYQEAVLRDGSTIVHRGWLDDAPRQAEGGAEGWQYVLNGPMRWFDRLPYKAQRWGAEGLDDSGAVILGAKTQVVSGVATTQRLTLVDQLTEVCQRVAASGAPVLFDIDIGDVHIPFERRISDSCMDVLLALLQHAPGATGYWTHGALKSTLHIREGGNSHTCSEAMALTRVAVRPRYDQLVSKVEIIYRYSRQDAEEDEGLAPYVNQFTHEDGVTAGVGQDGYILGAARTLSRTVELQAGETIAPLIEGTTIAQKVAEYAFRLQIEASFQEDGVDWNRRPGDVWSFGPAIGLGEGRTGIGQTIVRDLHLGTETINVGPALHLGVDGLIGQWKRRSRQGDSTAPQNPSGDGGEGGQQGESATTRANGAVQVTLGPAAVRDAEPPAKWAVPGRAARISGATVRGVPAGEITVTFTPLDGWVAPAPVTITVEEGETASVPEDQATYTQTAGALGLSFALEIRRKADEGGGGGDPQWEWRVAPGTFRERADYSDESIIALEGIGEWRDAALPVKAWIEIDLDGDGEVEAGTLKDNSAGTFDETAPAWTADSLVEQEDDASVDYRQTKARKLIGQITQPAPSAPPVIAQAFVGDLVLEDRIIDLHPARYPVLG